MPWLPPIADHSNLYLLPLRGCTENRLCQMLLGADAWADASQRNGLLADTLRADAAFTLWSVIHIQRRENTSLPTLELLAEALAEPLPELLESDNSPAACAESIENARWIDLYAASLAVSQEASRSCTLPADKAAAQLLGLVHDAESWLQIAARTSTQTSDSPDHTAILLPEWLHEQLNAIRTNRVTTPVPLAVRLAIDAHRAGSLPEHTVEPVADQATFLPLLFDKLKTLATLETRFDETLEVEKIASLQQFAYGLSHEINNPLANIATRSQTLLRDEPHPERRRKLNTINRQAFRAHEMIADAMLFAKPPPLEKRQINVAELIEQVVVELQVEAEQQGTTLGFQVPAELTLCADPDHLAVAIRALCVNSLQALSTGGSLEISALQLSSPPVQGPQGELIQITVRDTGPGIPAEVRRHLFDPYFSGREAGRGLGLGLSKCWRVVELHGGKMEVTSSEGVGTTFTITLPAML